MPKACAPQRPCLLTNDCAVLHPGTVRPLMQKGGASDVDEFAYKRQNFRKAKALSQALRLPRLPAALCTALHRITPLRA